MSSFCPYCGVEIIEGVDECEQCGQTLTEMSMPVPASRVELGLITDRIEVLPPRTPSTVTVDATVGEALKQMVRERIGCVMVTEGDKLVGIFSEKDAVQRLNADAAKLLERPITQYMTRNPETLSSRDKIAFALHRMNLGGYRHIPILEDGQLAGVISIRDILDYLSQRILAESLS